MRAPATLVFVSWSNVKRRSRLDMLAVPSIFGRMSATPKHPFDVYRKKSNSALRLATRHGAPLPRQFPPKDWVLMSEQRSTLHSEAAKDIAIKGYCYFQVING